MRQLVSGLVLGAWALTAAAQSAACPTPEALLPPQLHGAWRVQFDQPPPGWPAQAKVRLQAHQEFKDSLAGTVDRAPAPGQPQAASLAGDLDEGVLVLDESSDGVRITAVWEGRVVPGSCGREIRGYWKDTRQGADSARPAAESPFVLRR